MKTALYYTTNLVLRPFHHQVISPGNEVVIQRDNQPESSSVYTSDNHVQRTLFCIKLSKIRVFNYTPRPIIFANFMTKRCTEIIQLDIKLELYAKSLNAP